MPSKPEDSPERPRTRLRWTVAAVCLVLVVLGGTDLAAWAPNREVHPVSLAALAQGPTPGAWLRIEGGRYDLVEAISTSGTVDLEALLVPLSAPPVQVWVETRDPKALELFARYHLALDSDQERADFLRAHEAELRGARTVTGMVLGGLTARANRDAMQKLAREAGFEVAPQALFLTEGKEPEPARGFAFTLLGLVGLAKLGTDALRRRRNAATTG